MARQVDESYGQELSSLDFAGILGAPIVACANAQMQAALATMTFIKAVAFKSPMAAMMARPSGGGGGGGGAPSGGGGGGGGGFTGASTTDNPSGMAPVGGRSLNNDMFGQPLMVAFRYYKTMPSGITEQVALVVPFLCIIPVPTLRIKSMTLEFNVRIEGDISSNRSSNADASGGSSRASTSSQTTFSSGLTMQRDYSLDIKMTVVSEEVPVGIERITKVLESSLKEVVLIPDATKEMLDSALKGEGGKDGAGKGEDGADDE